ncbi:NUDIX hydrolase [Conexibacter sp. DBS9H8]|uniref:NUDIX hydrolase n=1 Tax=Conexibacter sp. DBS9H8 TaxID=2937801 RepID=UPI00200DC1FF|nr:NUDIX domain-containing protein [Conexibacter sp. DBS9H8]
MTETRGHDDAGDGEMVGRWVLARGPWPPGAVRVGWRSDPFRPDAAATEEADRLLRALADRGSPSHDGLAARLVSYDASPTALALELQPVRWALRLIDGGAVSSISALCVVRSADGRWLAGRRAAWVASWAGRWALGAGGAVEVDEDPTDTLSRELAEEWSVRAERLSVEALVKAANGNVLFIGQAWLAPGAEVTPDHEHDAHAWWPADVDAWPAEADPPLCELGRMLSPGAA